MKEEGMEGRKEQKREWKRERENKTELYSFFLSFGSCSLFFLKKKIYNIVLLFTEL